MSATEAFWGERNLKHLGLGRPAFQRANVLGVFAQIWDPMPKVKAGLASVKTCKPIHARLIPVEQIDNGPHPWDVRGDDNHGHVQRLARSLEMNGGRLEHPIVVRPHPTDHHKFQRISGSCRLLAATSNGRAEIPAVIRELSEKQARLVALTENMGRQAPRCLLKLGWVILPLLEETGSKQKDLADLIGCQESKISDALKYARIIPEVEADQIARAHGITKDVVGGFPRRVLKEIEQLPPVERREAVREACREAAREEVGVVRGAKAGGETGLGATAPYAIHCDGTAIVVSIANASSIRLTEFVRLLREIARVCWGIWRNHRRGARRDEAQQQGDVA